jgi:lysosomal Pro-X carboxypeptidase
MPQSRSSNTPGVANATARWFANRVDHLSSDVPPTPGGNLTYAQRFFVNDDHWSGVGGPVFFYCGNEANVELYVNATGLMWERAEEFGALLVWGEHRYYGESQPLGSAEAGVADKRFLSVEQALADFAALVGHVKDDLDSPDSAVIAFGGSYGGMLASWLRYKYPHVVDGAIAASAPIFSFEGERPAANANFYAEGVTYDVQTKGGASSEWCEGNFRAAFAAERLAYAGATAEGRAALVEGFNLCEGAIDTEGGDDDGDGSSSGWDVTYWLNTALSYLAMGNYPYPSSYILNGDGKRD